MSYAIFRVEPINKLNALSQIGAHNTRTKQAYKSNPDIDMSKSQNNIDIVPLSHNNYYNSYMNLVKEYKDQHKEIKISAKFVWAIGSLITGLTTAIVRFL